MAAGVVIPGDVIPGLQNSRNSEKIVLGPGLRRELDSVVATKCGFLKKREPNIYWVDNHQKKYIPVRGESVIGIVTQKAGDIFKVDIGGSEVASISYLTFEGATKRNRPNVQIGDILFAKVLASSKDMEAELTCVDRHGKKAGMGVLDSGGFMFTVPLNLVHKLLSSECVLMKLLGQQLPFEVSIGANGRIWARAKSLKNTIAVCNAILLSEYMTNDEIKIMCQKIFDTLAGF